MVRPLVWTGSAWADARVWTGSQWKAYTPPVYGGTLYRQDFNEAGLGGFSGTGGTNSVYTVQNWSNIHIYIDTDSAWVYPPYGTMERTGSISAPIAQGIVQPGKTYHVQASLYRPLVSGSAATASGQIGLYARFNCPELSSTETPVSATATTTGANWGWSTLTTTGFSIPATGNSYKPHTLKLTYVRAEHYQGFSGMGDPSGVYRLYMDWIRVIDGSSNQTIMQTTAAVEPMKVWNGTAWV